MEYAATPGIPGSVSVDLQGFLQKVFGWMFAGLVVTALAALAIGSDESLLTSVTENPLILIGVFVVQLGLVVALTAMANRLSVPVAAGMFFVYAALNGVIFAVVVELYTSESIFTTFLITAGMFGALAVFGYTTKRDLSGLGSILFMALIGLILASIVNIWVGGTVLYWITTYAGVLIFAGLTAYDMQKLKNLGSAGLGEEAESKAAVQGALALYLDFINLFLFLLRIFGQRR
ncbi:MAG: Bax inhibitor-1/YccA family protein [Solirubrobacteraceae bacterium]